MFQNYALFPYMTVFDNVAYGLKVRKEDKKVIEKRVEELLELVDLKGLEKRYPTQLSGGQRQRLTIARALVGKPDILILDDSASALDYATDAALRKALAALPGDLTVFIVSQRAASLQHADQIIVLDDGRMVGLGRHAELLKTCWWALAPMTSCARAARCMKRSMRASSRKGMRRNECKSKE